MGESRPLHLIIITGMSGAGKTVAIQSLEDLGFYCVDNLPPVLIPKFVDLMVQSGGKINRAALVIDLRGREFFETLSDALEALEQSDKLYYQILFLDADDKTLVRRYKETRRRHPLLNESSPIEGITAERKLLDELKGKASQIIDTSLLKPSELKEKMITRFSDIDQNRFSVNMMSFGFKYGVPIDADLIFDVRFLANPHYIDSLRPQTGLDQPVYDYVMKWPETKEFLNKLMDLLTFLVPKYQQEGKSQVVIGIGCTGGKHRSVAITEYIAKFLQSEWHVSTNHRDIEKDRK
ncbi:RNase adapter RapZ [Tepidibacillus infernus]|uniref:RNase adaptor protein RapZ n=1 Tax=Tepidibacillus decaturensis TaxID=1413211 RepID=A0A135L5U6_9BACI|nr:RNase adapter RapZ [Tepidibacillus decaturensis]KXG44384.1 RNase adaptor protein RapZ [Tepidibacillus decaturensis]